MPQYPIEQRGQGMLLPTAGGERIMATFLKRLGWLVLMTTILSAAPMARADGDGCSESSGGGSGGDSYYWLAYQQWLQFQQKLYEDRRHDAEVRAEQMRQDRLDRQLYHPPV